MGLSAVIIAWGALCSVWGVLLLSQTLAVRGGLLLRPAPAGDVPDPVPSACVVIAARNEGRAIVACVRAILAQDYPAASLEVVVVDDRSDDDTAACVDTLAREDPRVRLVRVDHLPPGWMGKSHALWCGTRTVRADWILFTDADCTLDPPAVRTAVLEARHHGAQLLSLWPRNAAAGFWEHLLIPLCGGIIALWYGSLRADPAAARPFANGQFLLIERAAYERIGGHRAVRDCLIEDIPLAEHARAAGLTSRVAGGRDLYRVRMYDSFRSVVNGWSRIYAGSLRSGAKVTLSVLWLLLGSLLPFAAAPLLLWLLATRGGADTGTIVLTGLCAQHGLLVIVVSYRFWGMGGCDRRYLWLYPLSAALVACILCRAGWWLQVRRRVSWRHTTYAIDHRGRVVCQPHASPVRPSTEALSR